MYHLLFLPTFTPSALLDLKYMSAASLPVDGRVVERA